MKNLLHTKTRRRTKFNKIKLYVAIAVILSISLYIIIRGTMDFSREIFNMAAEAPTHAVAVAKEKSSTSVHVPTEHEQIVAYIKEVFGSDSDKAFKLLSCENHALNPKALNDNTSWGGIGQDLGIFQINTVWQGVSNKAFLYNWRINIDIAHDIYVRDGKQFKLWTCGRKLGI